MPTQFTNTQDFFFNTPLYTEVDIDYETAMAVFRRSHRVDGWCRGCGRESTFLHTPTNASPLGETNNKPHFAGTLWFKCVRNEDKHVVTFHCRLVSGALQKTGQFPSFADIALDQSKKYAKLLGAEYSSEFHKAIGLAAHGVGIGSFVYMRRIFEKLIQNRFDEFKHAEKWSEQEFRDMRMAERIRHLKAHLPEFLVRNTKLYSIMSRGIHELDEETCLSAFNLIKGATIIILEEDQKKKEELARQAAFEKEIAAFDAPKASETISLADLGAKYFQNGEDAV
jgi:hypothetical protein